ncbi:MAG TPA: glycosyltransferase family 4 protein [Candidatus Acidoferrales bacterium]|nr:glycosyltransferase family 4 protein [Candidatus Acidoferrales bacterium]
MTGVNVVGLVSGSLGLGTAARATISALTKAGVPVAVVDLDFGSGHARKDLTWEHLFLPSKQALPHPITVVHLNPPQAYVAHHEFAHLFAARFNAIVPFFEPPMVPVLWPGLLNMYDAVLAPSEHIASSLRNAVAGRVISYPLACESRKPARADRARYGIPENAFVFIASFDRGSGSSRKNGAAVVRAFAQAFHDDDRAMLVLKLNGTAFDTSLEDALRSIDPAKCLIVDGYMAYEDVLGLYDVCDAFVSLHRAEGLGLGLMEAMMLGKPVVATGWSGNLDFMDGENSLLVRYSFTPILDHLPEYRQTNYWETVCWAEPDVSHAAALMRRLVDEPGLAAKIGEKARASVMQRQRAFFEGGAAQIILDSYRALVPTAR